MIFTVIASFIVAVLSGMGVGGGGLFVVFLALFSDMAFSFACFLSESMPAITSIAPKIFRKRAGERTDESAVPSSEPIAPESAMVRTALQKIWRCLI